MLLTTRAHAQTGIPDAPNPPRLVNDLAGVMSAGEVQTLEQKLNAYNDSTSTQVAVVLVESLNDYEVADFANKLGEKWGIGQKGKNNGVLLLASIGDRKVTIQTGYGVEGNVTDMLTQQIIQENIKPNFRNQAYYQGVDEATTRIIKALSGEYKADPRSATSRGDNDRNGGGGAKSPSLATLLIIGIILLFIFSRFSRNRGTTIGSRGGGCGGGGCLPGFLLGNLLGGGRGGMFGSGGSGMFGGGGGGFGGGGGGGGGFGGFGGGSFGGGGSSGNW